MEYIDARNRVVQNNVLYKDRVIECYKMEEYAERVRGSLNVAQKIQKQITYSRMFVLNQ